MKNGINTGQFHVKTGFLGNERRNLISIFVNTETVSHKYRNKTDKNRKQNESEIFLFSTLPHRWFPWMRLWSSITTPVRHENGILLRAWTGSILVTRFLYTSYVMMPVSRTILVFVLYRPVSCHKALFIFHPINPVNTKNRHIECFNTCMEY